MARQRITLVPDEVKQETNLREQILTGEMTPEVFATLSPEEQAKVNEVLFKIASEKVDPNKGASALEFILFAFMRLVNKKLNNLSLNQEDLEVQDALNQILAMHEITNETPKANWLFDYMSYAQAKAQEFLENRREHVQRKLSTIGEV
jgi:hypothetical protein